MYTHTVHEMTDKRNKEKIPVENTAQTPAAEH